MNYREYLQEKGLNEKSIRSYEISVKSFEDWIEIQNEELERLDYEGILSFVNYSRESGNKERTISHKLRAVKYWLDYMNIKPNPCKGWQIKSRGKPLPSPLLTTLEIDRIYHSYPEKEAHEIRSKVILGLMCYQALDGGEIGALKLSSVNEEMGIILIEKKTKTASRSLRITDQQAPILKQYLRTIRTKILGKNQEEEKLIVHHGINSHIRNILRALYDRLSKKHERFRSIRQLRASVISNWLKDHNLREVQYMAGHKYVSSTERYLSSRIEELQGLLDDIHPLK